MKAIVHFFKNSGNHSGELRRWGLALALSVALVSFAEIAEAQAPDKEKDVYNKNIHFFQPPSDGSGLITTWGSEPIGHLGFHFGTMMDYAHRPMEYTDPQDKVHTVIYNQTGVNMLFGFGLWEALNLSAAYVITPGRSFNSRYQEIYEWKESATEDARLSLKYMFTNRRMDGVGFALQAEATMPTGDEQNFVSDEQSTLAPRLIIDFGNEGFSLALNLGYKIYMEGEIDPGLFDIDSGDEVLLNLGGTLRVLWGLEFVGDLAARMYTGLNDYSEGYAEAFGALRSTWFVDNPLRLTLGGSSGLTDGVGTPIFRFYGGLTWFFRGLGR